ncbi:MAG: class I SAM-dependent RNA methyltransferase [Nocardioidaceae bacterium]
MAELTGVEVELDIGAVAHGGHCVARWDGRVVFVRHTLPGERVRVRITEGDDESRFLRADAIDVLRASPGRVPTPCPYAGPGQCGGCDFQHADGPTQRRLLGDVVAEQLSRLTGLDRDVAVEQVGDGLLGWRTRVTFAVGPDGRLGLRAHRSHDVIAVDRCRIAHPDLPQVTGDRWPVDSVQTVVSSEGDRIVVVSPRPRGRLPRVGADGVVTADGDRLRGRTSVHEDVRARSFKVSAGGFWQVHPDAAETLVAAVLSAAAVQPGDRVADLYAGVGLFSVFLAEAVGDAGVVVSVESSPAAVRDARRNVHDLPQVRVLGGRVDGALRGDAFGESCDVVVLDPPRTGAKRPVVEGITGLSPRRVVYVACDPAALARDVATFMECGYRLDGLRAFALFPMTHHVECVALLTKSGSDLR